MHAGGGLVRRAPLLGRIKPALLRRVKSPLLRRVKPPLLLVTTLLRRVKPPLLQRVKPPLLLVTALLLRLWMMITVLLLKTPLLRMTVKILLQIGRASCRERV